MKTMVKAGWLVLLVGGALALPAQEAGAAAACHYKNGHKVCGATTVHKPVTKCTKVNGVTRCHKVY
jgi:hypothetical protein